MTSNRELQRGAAEVENTLAVLRDSNQRELSALQETRDRLAESESEESAAAEADRQRATSLEGSLHATKRAVEDAVSELKSRREMVVAAEKSLDEDRKRMLDEEERRVEALRVAREKEKEAKAAVVEARTRLDQSQVFRICSLGKVGKLMGYIDTPGTTVLHVVLMVQLLLCYREASLCELACASHLSYWRRLLGSTVVTFVRSTYLT